MIFRLEIKTAFTINFKAVIKSKNIQNNSESDYFVSQAIGRHVINKFVSQAIGRRVINKFVSQAIGRHVINKSVSQAIGRHVIGKNHKFPRKILKEKKRG